MTKIKLCGLSRPCDIEAANELKPEYIGFVFAPESRRYVAPTQAEKLKAMLCPNIKAVGVFVNAPVETVTKLLMRNIIDIAQLHGSEDESYIARLRKHTDKPIIKAFRIASKSDIENAAHCTAEHILLDSGAGTGEAFDWSLLQSVRRPYFLAGGLEAGNVAAALRMLHPYAVDVSSGIETGGLKDKMKMAAFVAAVRKENRI